MNWSLLWLFCCRYEWNGKPLILSSRSKVRPSLETIPNCSKCNSPRVFELQLMPSLVNYLKDYTNTLGASSIIVAENGNYRNGNENKNGQSENGHNSENGLNGESEQRMECRTLPITEDDGETRVEFGCIYIYSCSKACWDNGSDLCPEEFVVVQPDPDVDLLKWFFFFKRENENENL